MHFGQEGFENQMHIQFECVSLETYIPVCAVVNKSDGKSSKQLE